MRLTKEAALLYTREIISHIEDAFPNSVVEVWINDSVLLYQYGDFIDIKARADNKYAFVTVFLDSKCSAEYVANLLISMMKGEKK